MEFPPHAALPTLRHWLRFAEGELLRSGVFFGHGTDNASDEAAYLLCNSLGREIFESDLDTPLTELDAERLREVLSQRIDQRIPAAYLIGESWFMGLPFEVNEHVLVPRSPIAELIDQGFQPWLGDTPVHRILDLCTGSGCIGIACAYAFADADVVLSDISEPALAVAERNIAKHQLEARVQAVKSDVFDQLVLQGSDAGRFDIIVSNPPYVDAGDLASMPAEYQHEPAIALGSGDDGLDISRRILAEAAAQLNPGGLLVLEVGNSWEHLEQAFPEVPFMWLEFAMGGHGVFAMRREELLAYFA